MKQDNSIFAVNQFLIDTLYTYRVKYPTKWTYTKIYQRGENARHLFLVQAAKNGNLSGTLLYS